MLGSIRTALVVVCTVSSVWAGAPVVEQDGASYTLTWDNGITISDSTFAVLVNGSWIHGDAFPRHTWSTENGRRTLTCSGLPPFEYFELTIETQSGRPYATFSAALTASEACELGGVRVLTKKDDARNLSIGSSSKGWNVFVEALRAPDYGRIYWLDQLAELTPGRKDDPRDAFWVSTLQNDASNRTLAFAALKGELWPTAFRMAQC